MLRGDGPHVRMAIDAQDPVDVRRDGLGDIVERFGEADQALAAGRLQVGLARVEQHFGLKYEPVADDADVLAPIQHLAQATEEVGAVLCQLLDFGNQSPVELTLQIDDRGLLARVSILGLD